MVHLEKNVFTNRLIVRFLDVPHITESFYRFILSFINIL